VNGHLDLTERWTASSGSPLAGLSGFGKLWLFCFFGHKDFGEGFHKLTENVCVIVVWAKPATFTE
jgi:hypothetical protein